jgi:hypothetical protein
MRNKMTYQEELALRSKYVSTVAYWNDWFYEFECPCLNKTVVGRNKTELLDNFANHFETCSAR